MNGNIWRDVALFGLSVIAAVVLAISGSVPAILGSLKGFDLLGAFIAGFLFVSVFTAAPAGVVFVDIIVGGAPLWPTVGLAALGAMVSDLLIFLFIKNGLTEHVSSFIGEQADARLKALFRYRLFRWFSIFLGALIIASPLPDEVGLVLMGFSKIKKRFLMPLSFVLNGAGLLVIALAAKAIG